VTLETDVARAGRSVLERCAVDLDGSPVGIVLGAVTATDRGRVVGVAVVDRVVGTAALQQELDSIGIAPGSEWKADQARADDEGEAHTGACVTATIVDPRREVPVGTVGVTCSVPESAQLMLPYVQLIARVITQRLLDGAAAADRTLLEKFVRARRRSRGAIVAINGREMLANAAASRLVHDDDHATMWNWTSSRLRASDSSPHRLQLQTGSVTVRCEPVAVGGETVGALLHLAEVVRPLHVVHEKAARASGSHAVGWDSLLVSELGIATLVTEGLTNREIGARLFMSRHTVDYKLRLIFRKLSIGSRVELARLAAENTELGHQPSNSFHVVA
jgi:DNA-binding CsgD family transcriptional regulator